MAIEDQNQPGQFVGYEIVEHTADWALRVWGRNLEELFTTAAEGMAHLMVADPDELSLEEYRHIELRAFDIETLLVDWLGELAFLAEDQGLVFREFTLSMSPELSISAKVWGGRTDELVKHIKAVTYHDLVVKETATGFEATVVFDV